MAKRRPAKGRPKASTKAAKPVKPPSPEVVRAQQLHGAGQLPAAEEAYRAVLTRRPRDVHALAGLGMLRAQLGAMDEAIELVGRAAERDRASGELRGRLAVLRYIAGDYDGAFADAERTVALDPKIALGHALMASCLERRHRLDDARISAARALELDAGNVSAHLVLAEVERREKDYDAADARLRALLARRDVQGPDRADAQHKLAMTLDAQQKCDEAYTFFKAYAQTILADPATRRVDAALWYRRIRHYRQTVTPERLAGHAARPDAPEANGGRPPAFLVGFSRSGTTMIEQMLAAHPDVVTSSEAPVIRNTKRRLAGMRPGREDIMGMLGSLNAEERRTLRAGFWEEAATLTGTPLGGRQFVHKQPMNTIDLGFINALLPEARVIFVQRDPRDVCLSCFKQSFVVNPANIHFLTLEGTARFYAATMELWQHFKTVLTLPILEVRYEAVVEDVETHARALIAHLGLEWDDGVLDFQGKARARAVTTPSYAAVTEKVTNKAVGKWAGYADALAPVLPMLEPWVKGFGYE